MSSSSSSSIISLPMILFLLVMWNLLFDDEDTEVEVIDAPTVVEEKAPLISDETKDELMKNAEQLISTAKQALGEVKESGGELVDAIDELKEDIVNDKTQDIPEEEETTIEEKDEMVGPSVEPDKTEEENTGMKKL